MLKDWLKKVNDDLFLVLTIVLVALIGFALGRISAIREEKFPIRIQPAALALPNLTEAGLPAQAGDQKETKLVGSKNGTVYHLSNCSGAARIKEENKIYFSSKEEAQKAGYRPAANCPGL